MIGLKQCKSGVLMSVQALAHALFPAKCLVCGNFYHAPPVSGDPDQQRDNGDSGNGGTSCDHEFPRLMSPHMCAGCAMDFAPIAPPMCPVCGVMFQAGTGESHLCGACLKQGRAYDKARAAGTYAGALMAAVHALKYRGKIQLADPLGRLLFSTFTAHWPPGSVDLVVPVPLHAGKLRSRGFNQSALLIRDWSRRRRITEMRDGGVSINQTCLVRERRTWSQTGLDKKARVNNVKNAFFVRSPREIRGKRVLIVDDVYTTGATLAECANVLKKAGALRVDVLTLARTI